MRVLLMTIYSLSNHVFAPSKMFFVLFFGCDGIVTNFVVRCPHQIRRTRCRGNRENINSTGYYQEDVEITTPHRLPNEYYLKSARCKLRLEWTHTYNEHVNLPIPAAIKTLSSTFSALCTDKRMY
ncbi:hypothetical protein PILCRDRAFT_511090 [Piloderma croceum F 1598]|uniref:Uncharacterized protein n=1 Tax=Piloderma croceum (strain F 1598) TaxID=765440 RepID=A0A0C3FMN7_PILCF|nr:hypothetical protein PILCRDRAFT_511090 [Piloderma croceum F 1598]